MISPEYCVMSARYARWQNRQVITALGGVEQALRRRSGPAGAALAQACARQILSDHLWLGRLDAAPRDPPADLLGAGLSSGYAEEQIDSWDDWRRDRQDLDARLLGWAKRQTQPALSGELFWFSPQQGRAVSQPCWLCVVQLFTLQTGYRGQISALLGQLGARAELGEPVALPQDVDWM